MRPNLNKACKGVSGPQPLSHRRGRGIGKRQAFLTLAVALVPGLLIAPTVAYAKGAPKRSIWATDEGGSGTPILIIKGTSTIHTISTSEQSPQGVAFAPDGALAYVTESNSVRVVSTKTEAFTGTSIPLPGKGGDPDPGAIAITPNGQTAYVADLDGTVSAINLSNDTVTTIQVAPVTGGNVEDVAISPDGSTVYASNFGGAVSRVSIISTASNTVVNTVSMANVPEGIAFTPSGSRAYVAVNNGTVNVIDTSTQSVVGSPISVGGLPRGVAVSANGALVDVTNEDSYVSMISAATNAVTSKVTSDIDAPEGDQSVVFDGNSKAYVANFGGGVTLIQGKKGTKTTAVSNTGGDAFMFSVSLEP
jgi:YVTN family beta-propeller protein